MKLKHIAALVLAFVGMTLTAEEDVYSRIALTETIDPANVVASVLDAKIPLPKAIWFNCDTGKPVAGNEKSDTSDCNVFYIMSEDGKNILIDAGTGAFLNCLSALKLKPDEVDAVLLTHVHPDHVGGLLDKSGIAAFPKAVIWLSKAEADAVSRPECKENTLWKSIERAYVGRIRTFEWNAKDLPGKLIPLDAHGHTPGHTVYRMQVVNKQKEEDDHILEGKTVKQVQDVYFIGDLVHSAFQFSDPRVVTKFDADPKAAADSVDRICRGAMHGHVVRTTIGNAVIHSLFFGAHLNFPGAGKIYDDDQNHFVFAEIEGK